MASSNLPIRRIYRERDFLAAMERGREVSNLTMEDVCAKAGVPDRYYNKVVMGLEPESVRDLRRRIWGREKPTGQGTTRHPFRMEESAAWMLQACGLALVVMPLEQAEALVESDPVIELDKAYRERLARRSETAIGQIELTA